jgi:hypothetical protein
MSLQPQRDVAAALDASGRSSVGDLADARCLDFVFRLDDSSFWRRLQVRRAAPGGI